MSAPMMATAFARPSLGLTLILIETGVVATLILVFGLIMISAILRGSDTTSERCFRLLRWIRNRPEPTAPRTGGG